MSTLATDSRITHETSVSPYRPPWSSSAITAFIAISMGIAILCGMLISVFDIDDASIAYLAIYGLGLVSPCIAALVYLRISTGSIRNVIRLYLPVRLNAGWTMIVLAPLSVIAAYLVAGLSGLRLDWSATGGLGPLLVGVFAWSSVMWAEETGWRGVLLPVLQEKWGPIAATLVVAIAWMLWHVPLLLLLDFAGTSWLWFLLQVVGLSFAMTWAANRSGTTLVAVLIHGGMNGVMLWCTTAATGFTSSDLMPVQAAGPLCLGLSALFLTRGRLGYRRPVATPL